MIQNRIIIEKRHKRFIETVCKSEIVYGLKNIHGFATSSSIHFEDEEENPIGLICFWSEKALAKSCIKNGWKNYNVEEISLLDFIENWCIGMYNDDLLIGTQFDLNMFGFEAEPLELVLDLIKELKNINKRLDLRKFENIDDLENQIKSILK